MTEQEEEQEEEWCILGVGMKWYEVARNKRLFHQCGLYIWKSHFVGTLKWALLAKES